MRNRFARWLPPLIYMAAIFYVSSQSNPLPAVTTVVWDKVLHMIEYGGLAVLLCRALRGDGVPRLAAVILALAIAAAYAASDEWHEGYVADRTPDVQDWLSDDLGAGLGAVAYTVLTRRSP